MSESQALVPSSSPSSVVLSAFQVHAALIMWVVLMATRQQIVCYCYRQIGRNQPERQHVDWKLASHNVQPAHCGMH